MNAKPKSKPAKRPEAMAPMRKDDHVYFKDETGEIRSGAVTHLGKHGFVCKVGGVPHRVLHSAYLGHKTRATLKGRVLEYGEDGALTQLEDGSTALIKGLTQQEEQMNFGKSFRMALLFKSDPVANRPGLALLPSKNGGGKRWQKTTKDAPAAAKPSRRPEPGPPKPMPKFEPKVGDAVGYGTGKERKTGKVLAIGKDGVTLDAPGGQQLKVPMAEIEKAGNARTFDPTANGSSKMSTEDINKLHVHAGDVPKAKPLHHNVETEDQAYAGADQGIKDFTRSLIKRGGLADRLGAEVFINDSERAIESLHEHPDTPVLMIAPLKGKDRAREKASKEGWDTVTDLVRGSIILPTLDDIPKALKALKASGIKVERLKNRFAEGNDAGGYRDMLMNMRLPNGHVGELQLHVAPMLMAKDQFGGHDHYNVHRDISENTEGRSRTVEQEQAFAHASKGMRELYDHAWNGARGIMPVPKEKGRG